MQGQGAVERVAEESEEEEEGPAEEPEESEQEEVRVRDDGAGRSHLHATRE